MSSEFHLRQRAIKLRLDRKSVQTICQKLERSRSWFYKWWQRWQTQGADGLRDQSRAPKQQPRGLSKAIQAAILTIRDRLVARRDRAAG